MILIVLAGLCVASVPLAGGNLGRLAELRLRCLWLAPLALAVQVVIVTIAPQGHPTLHAAVHVGTYALGGAFLWLNRKIPGAKVIAAGTLANVLAIVANGGVMPASATAEHLAGLTMTRGFHNSGVVTHPHLLWLGDNIPVPGPLPNVLSIGDCLIYAGMLVLLHQACRPAPAPAARSRDQAIESPPEGLFVRADPVTRRLDLVARFEVLPQHGQNTLVRAHLTRSPAHQRLRLLVSSDGMTREFPALPGGNGPAARMAVGFAVPSTLLDDDPRLKLVATAPEAVSKTRISAAAPTARAQAERVILRQRSVAGDHLVSAAARRRSSRR